MYNSTHNLTYFFDSTSILQISSCKVTSLQHINSFMFTHTSATLLDEMTMNLTSSSGLEKPGARGVAWTTSLLVWILNHVSLVLLGMAWSSRRIYGASHGNARELEHEKRARGWYCGFSSDGRDEGGGVGI
jgi:hypothetical protein